MATVWKSPAVTHTPCQQLYRTWRDPHRLFIQRPTNAIIAFNREQFTLGKWYGLSNKPSKMMMMIFWFPCVYRVRVEIPRDGVIVWICKHKKNHRDAAYVFTVTPEHTDSQYDGNGMCWFFGKQITILLDRKRVTNLPISLSYLDSLNAIVAYQTVQRSERWSEIKNLKKNCILYVKYMQQQDVRVFITGFNCSLY